MGDNDMKLKSLRQYADETKLSYESVRRKVRRLEDNELLGHVHYHQRTAYLDEIAVNILNEHRRLETIVIQEESQEAEELRARVAQLQEELLRSKDLVISLQKDCNRYLLESSELKAIQFDFELYKQHVAQKEAELDKLKENNKELLDRLETSESELEQYRRLKWWQKLFK